MSIHHNKPDYKKSFFEKSLNKPGVSINAINKLMKQFGYHYEYDRGIYYVYDSFEWKVKLEFEKTVKPLLDNFLGVK